MKTWFALLLGFALALPAQAGPKGMNLGAPWDAWAGRKEYQPYFQDMQNILQPLADREIGSLTLGQLRQTALELSVPMQKILHVRRSRLASFAFPGAGQFMNGDTLGGVLFTVAGLGLTAGTLIGGYALLPEPVQFHRLDYLDTPLSGIETAWKSQTLRDYLPTIAVLVGGSLLKGALRYWSSVDAVGDARKAIEEGRVRFEPRLLLPGLGAGTTGGQVGGAMFSGHMGFGLGLAAEY